MTKTNYAQIAGAFRSASCLISEVSASQGRKDAWATCVECAASVFSRNDPKFDQKAFLLACCDTVADRNSLMALVETAA